MLGVRAWRTGVLTAGLAVAAMAGLAGQPGQPAAPEPQSWLHVHVQGMGADAEHVALNLPLGAVGAVVAMAPEGIMSREGHLRVAERHGITVSEIRRAWRQLMAAGETQFVSIQDGEQTVRVARVGEQIQVRVEGDDETVRVDLPVVVVDALLSGDGETLNVAAAIEELQTLRGDIVRVVEDEREIRIWVDEVAEQ